MTAPQRLISCCLVLAGCLTLGLTAMAAASPMQTVAPAGPVSFYGVQRAVDPIVVDGRLDEFSWQRAAQINGFERILNDYDSIRHPTRAKMLWDDEFFYFGFACQDPDIWAIYAAEDDPMWSEEVVEVFIDPDGDQQRYLELEINPLNAKVDLLIYSAAAGLQSSIDWDVEGLLSAVSVWGTVNDSSSRDQGWVVEFAIPWRAMADSIDGGSRPVPGAEWRLNLYRIERRGGRQLKQQLDALSDRVALLRERLDELDSGDDDAALARAQEALATAEAEMEPVSELYNEMTEYTAWSETYRTGFHHPARFGVVRFIK